MYIKLAENSPEVFRLVVERLKGEGIMPLTHAATVCDSNISHFYINNESERFCRVVEGVKAFPDMLEIPWQEYLYGKGVFFVNAGEPGIQYYYSEETGFTYWIDLGGDEVASTLYDLYRRLEEYPDIVKLVNPDDIPKEDPNVFDSDVSHIYFSTDSQLFCVVRNNQKAYPDATEISWQEYLYGKGVFFIHGRCPELIYFSPKGEDKAYWLNPTSHTVESTHYKLGYNLEHYPHMFKIVGGDSPKEDPIKYKRII